VWLSAVSAKVLITFLREDTENLPAFDIWCHCAFLYVYSDNIIEIFQLFFFTFLFRMSSQVTFIYIALFTIQIVSKQLHSDNMKVVQHRAIILLNIKY